VSVSPGDLTTFGARRLEREPLVWTSHWRWMPHHAYLLATYVLQGLPMRAAHSVRAGIQAQQIRHTVAEGDADLLVSAALLHDIGYAPALVRTGAHAIDGADYLRSLGAPERLAALVAHHSEYRLLAEATGLAPELARFPREEGPVADALIHSDMTAGPNGTPMTVHDRLADIAARHAEEAPHVVQARLARVPRLLAAVERVHLRTTAPVSMSVPAPLSAALSAPVPALG
jgi:putative nucleotidyltransferase with HDIG domain